jgi:type I restriction enzyme M protein
MNHFREKADFIWRLAELLRGPYKPHQYGDAIRAESEELDALFERCEAGIRTGQEYRADLISAAVAGKIDVLGPDAGGET